MGAKHGGHCRIRAVESKLPKEFVPKRLPSFPQQEHSEANIRAFFFLCHAACGDSCRNLCKETLLKCLKVTDRIKETTPWLEIILQQDKAGT